MAGQVGIYVTDADGSNVTLLTDKDTFAIAPSWSPDGSKIAFTSDDGHIWTINADGSHLARLAFFGNWDDLWLFPHVWSPDGSKIAFHSAAEHENYEIYTIDVEGGKLTRLTNTYDRNFSPQWSPDGSRIAFTSRADDGSQWIRVIPSGRALPIHEPTTDLAALVAFWHAADGTNWTNSRNWLSDLHLGEWYGVGTDHWGRVTGLDLQSNQLSGEIPAELGSLVSLRGLDLSGNQLSGEIPAAELGSLVNLQDLNLSGNQLSGEIPAELGSLVSLRGLKLSGNQLSGEIPAAELGSLVNLQDLNLSGNQLSGEIPAAELGSLVSLRGLDLSGNQLSGEIPAELGSLVSLRGLDLSENQLSGEIPAELDSLVNLERCGSVGTS